MLNFCSQYLNLLKETLFFNVLKPLERNLIYTSFLSHFFSALMLFLAPQIGQKLFPSFSTDNQLLMMYALAMSSLCAQPLGVWICHYILNYSMPKIFLQFSIISYFFSIIVLNIVLILPYHPICVLFFICARIMQGLSASGEIAYMRFTLLDDKKQEHAYFITSLLETVTIVATIMASFLVGFFLANPDVFQNLWFDAFVFIFTLTLIITVNRFKILNYDKNLPTYSHKEDVKTRPQSIVSLIKQQPLLFLKLFFIQGLPQITYVVPFVLINLIIPKLNNEINSILFIDNCFLLILDLLLIPIFCGLFKKIPAAKTMLASCFFLTLLFLWHGFFIYPGTHYYHIEIFRILVVIFGVMYIVPQLSYVTACVKHIPSLHQKILITGQTRVVANAFFGKFIPFFLLYIFNITNKIYMSFHLMTFCFFVTLFFLKKQSE